MKRLVAMVMVLSFCSLSAWANAGHEGMNVDKKVEKMKKNLVLTDDQAVQIKAVLNEYKDKIEALMKEKHERVDAILTPEQRAKQEATKKEFKGKKKKDNDSDED